MTLRIVRHGHPADHSAGVIEVGSDADVIDADVADGVVDGVDEVADVCFGTVQFEDLVEEGVERVLVPVGGGGVVDREGDRSVSATATAGDQCVVDAPTPEQPGGYGHGAHSCWLAYGEVKCRDHGHVPKARRIRAEVAEGR